jgi:hypothetical protein
LEEEIFHPAILMSYMRVLTPEKIKKKLGKK